MTTRETMRGFLTSPAGPAAGSVPARGRRVFGLGRSPWRALAILLLALTVALPAPAATKVKDLPLRYRTWLEEVEIILRKEERKAFLELEKDYQRDAFIREFWRSRDPYPETAKNEFEDRWLEQRAEAYARFKDLSDDRTRIWMLHGEPDLTKKTDCLGVLWPLDIWLYHKRGRLPDRFHIIFYQPFGGGPFKRWTPRDGYHALIQRGSSTGSLVSDNRDELFRLVEAKCHVEWQIILGAVTMTEAQEATGGNIVVEYAPKVRDTEWLDTFNSYSTDLDAGKDGELHELTAELGFGFPEAQGQRTLVQAVVTVAPQTAQTAQMMAGTALYSFLVTGEILRQDELFDSFRYQFDLPAEEAADGRLPLVFERLLRPGEYRWIVKIEDQNGGGQARYEEAVTVPKVEGPPPDDPAVTAALDAAAGSLADDAPRVEIVPPEGDVLTGNVRLEATVSGAGVRKVRFEMDGKAVLTKTRPPYSVELLLGDVPRTHEVAAIGLDNAGHEVARDEILLNGGTQRFAVRLVDPKPGSEHSVTLTAVAEVQVPDGRSLEKVELYLDEQRVATLYQPPYRQPMKLAPGAPLQVVRAVATLTDGTTTEATALINAPGYTEDVEVRMVELYAAVLDRAGRPVLDLGRDDFRVEDGGQPQNLARFERVSDLPIHSVLLIDTSASMAESLPQAQRAAIGFLEAILTPKDRAAVITFSDRPLLAAPFTNDLDTLAGALAGLRAERGTGLYDSIVYALQYLKGIRGQRALLLLTDGSDRASRFSWGETLEFAQRSGVTIYPVGLGIGALNLDSRLRLDRLAGQTGGRSFFIETAEELDGVYAQIQDELRARYLLAYQPQAAQRGGDFRPIDVKVDRPGLTVETIKGYYP
jgi:Ca-activated chloride channel family protein